MNSPENQRELVERGHEYLTNLFKNVCNPRQMNSALDVHYYKVVEPRLAPPPSLVPPAVHPIWHNIHCCYALQGEFLEARYPDKTGLAGAINFVEEMGDMLFYLSHIHNFAFTSDHLYIPSEEYYRERALLFTSQMNVLDIIGPQIASLTDHMKKILFYGNTDLLFCHDGEVFRARSVQEILYDITFAYVAMVQAIKFSLMTHEQLDPNSDYYAHHVQPYRDSQSSWDHGTLHPLNFLLGENQVKLEARYPTGKFSKEHAKQRLDKAPASESPVQ